MVASSPTAGIPASATAGDFARVIGVTERVVAGRKADGRLPKLANGSIDLHAVIKAGVTALAQRAHSNSPEGKMTPAEAYDDALRTGASVGAHLAVTKIMGDLNEDAQRIARGIVEDACELFEIPGPEW